MKRYYNFSYPINYKTPLYPGTPAVNIRKIKDKKKGDSCNTYRLAFSNHTGTHIDAPRHFFNSGRTINAYSIEDFIFCNPQIADCRSGKDEVIRIKDLKNSIRGDKFDILLIRTGFSKYRLRERHIYCYQNPCLSPEAAEWLKANFSNLKVIGIDCISVSSYAHRDLGRRVHRILLGNSYGRPILILEDMNIPSRVNKINKLIIAPFFIEGADSAPCTVIGRTDD